jgi:uncharacterized membrane protein
MSDRSRSVEEYLARLGEALDVLGDPAAAEMVAEIGGHISDAIAERNGDADAVLAEFGTPEALATRILEERGILSGAPSVAEAPAGTRLLAGLLDIAVWLFAIYVVLVALEVVALMAVVSNLHALAAVAFYAVAAAVMGASIWWWAKARGRAGHSTLGMRLVGLRRVRVGDKVITVRLADVPGVSRPSRLLPALMVGFALLVIVPALLSEYGVLKANQRAEQAGVVSEVSMAASVVGELYQQVENRTSLNDEFGNVAPSARSGVSDLIGRHARGQLDGYVVDRLELVSYKADNAGAIPWFAPPAGAVVSEIVVRAHVSEYAKNSAEGRAYVVQVRQRTTSDGGSGGPFSMGYGASGTALIESIAPDSEQ